MQEMKDYRQNYNDIDSLINLTGYRTLLCEWLATASKKTTIREFLSKLWHCFGKIFAFLFTLCEFLFNNKIIFNANWKLLMELVLSFWFCIFN